MDTLSLLLYIVIGILSPFLVDVVTKKLASTQVKTLTLLAINLLTGVVVSFSNAHQSHLVFDWKAGLLAAGASFVSGAAAVLHFKHIDLIGVNGPLATAGGLGSVDLVKKAAQDLLGAANAPVVVVVPEKAAAAPVEAPGAITDPLQ